MAYQQRRAILDGNVKRVLARYCGIDGSPAIKSVELLFWQQAEALLPEQNVDRYTQALMDMGATLCTRSKPKCGLCPLQSDCVAYQTERVAQLPTPRERKTVPERRAMFMLAMDGRDILLEKRGPAGIWGGLWCLPQLEEGDEELAEYAQRKGWTITEQIPLAGFTHTFSHFKLHITPLLLNLAHKPLQLQQVEHVWMDVSEALTAAIPTPVRQLLETIAGR